MSAPAIMVLGAGGFVGLNTVRAFLEAGVTPQCGRRPRGNVLGLRGLGVPLVATDFGNAEALTQSLQGVEVLVHAAAHYPRVSHHLEETLERGRRELRSVLNAAAHAGVRRLVFVSSTATVAPHPDRASTETDVHVQSPTWGTYHQLKWELEQLLALERRFEVLVVCPAACLGPYDWKVGTSALLLAMARGSPPPHPQGKISTVDVRDVAQALVRLSLELNVPKRLLLAANHHDAHSLFQHLAQRYGCSSIPQPLSAEAARTLADTQERAAEQSKGRAQLSRELVDLIIHGPTIDGSAAVRWGLNYRPLSETLDAWDEWALRMGLIHRPPESHSHDRGCSHPTHRPHGVSTFDRPRTHHSPGTPPS